METISLTSKVLHRLGSFFIGTPHSLGEMPDDFYFDIGDRVQPMPQDIRKREVLGRKLLTNFYRLDQTYRLGPIVSTMCFVAVLGLSLVSGSLIAKGKVVLADYQAHEVTVAAEKQADAMKALGAINAANCSAQVDAINAASTTSATDKALLNFASNCQSSGFLASGGNPLHYHARKFTTESLGQVSQSNCQAHLADFNALTAKDNWQSSLDSDDSTLNMFRSNCEVRGFIHTSEPMAPHPVYN